MCLMCHMCLMRLNVTHIAYCTNQESTILAQTNKNYVDICKGTYVYKWTIALFKKDKNAKKTTELISIIS